MLFGVQRNYLKGILLIHSTNNRFTFWSTNQRILHLLLFDILLIGVYKDLNEEPDNTSLSLKKRKIQLYVFHEDIRKADPKVKDLIEEKAVDKNVQHFIRAFSDEIAANIGLEFIGW